MKLRSIAGIQDFKGARVILRVDMNVPFGMKQEILDDFRIRASLPTIKFILARRGKIFLITHRAHPHRRDPKLTVQPIARRLSLLLGRPIKIISDPERQNQKNFKEDAILFCENIRFWPGEDNNSRAFAKILSRWGTIYVNDAFAESHRTSASIVGLPQILKSYAGFLLAKEVENLGKIFSKPKRPYLVIMGGAKISTKISYIRSFLKEADWVALGGALFNTLLAAEGREVGCSIVEKKSFPEARLLLRSSKVVLPRDVRTFHHGSAHVHPEVHNLDDIHKGDYICDIGPQSLRIFESIIRKSKTILWNGPLGYIEMLPCRKGTLHIARALKRANARVVIGGGELDALWKDLPVPKKNIYVSTGGGALLEFVVHGELPGLRALSKFSSHRRRKFSTKPLPR